MYDPNFIPDVTIPLPEINELLKGALFDEGKPVHHTRYSLIFNEERGFATCAAHNIDGNSIIPLGVIPRKNPFRYDPKIPNDIQVGNDQGYSKNPWDRGHLVRRRSLHWGDITEAEQADRDSFFYSNISPQHEHLHDTAWGAIEDWMLELADEHDKKAAIFTGPVFTQFDPEIQNDENREPFRLPAGFWKIMAIKHFGELRAAGFLVWQRDFDNEEPLGFKPFLEQVRITTIEFLTGLSFGELRNADPLRYESELGDTRGLEGDAIDVQPTNRATAVMTASDICMF